MGKDIQPYDVSIDDVPTIITEKFGLVKQISKKIDDAAKKADSAMSAADAAKEKSAGMFHRKEAIESLQSATSELADAQLSSVQALETLFDYQKKLTEVTKYLFGLGVTNIAMNRSVVQELELRLKGASKKELNDLARREITNVVKQLKAQEDIMVKQSELTEKVKMHESELTLLKKRADDQTAHEAVQDGLLQEHTKKDAEHDRLIRNVRQKALEHDTMLSEKNKKDISQDAELARQSAVDEELKRRIDADAKKDEVQDREMARQSAVDEELERKIDEGEEKDRSQDAEIANLAAREERSASLIRELTESNLEKEKKIRELTNICDALTSQISEVQSLAEDKEKNIMDILERKAGKVSVIVSGLIGLAGIIIGVISYFV